MAHCETITGPVVQAARRALEQKDVMLVLPWVPAECEADVVDAFRRTLYAHEMRKKEVSDLADQWFFETVVRLHCAGEGRPYTGLYPDDPRCTAVDKLADEAIATGECAPLVEHFTKEVECELRKRVDATRATANFDTWDIPGARKHLKNKLALIHFIDGVEEYLAEHAQTLKRERIGKILSAMKHRLVPPAYRPDEPMSALRPIPHVAHASQ